MMSVNKFTVLLILIIFLGNLLMLKGDNVIRGHIILFIGVFFGGILLSNITEDFFSKPAKRLMNLVTGFGLKGREF